MPGLGIASIEIDGESEGNRVKGVDRFMGRYNRKLQFKSIPMT